MGSPSPHVPGRVQLGSFELDLRTGELRPVGATAIGDRLLLREQPFQILQMLVERQGKIVTRAEIQKRLWPNDTIVDFDHSINVAIGILRRAFGDAAANPRYIETLARRGYRLLVPVQWLESAPVVTAPSGSVGKGPLGDLTGKRVAHYRVLEVLGGGGMGMVYGAEDLKLGRGTALKFLPEELTSDPIALQRLEREAQTASALNHPNICTIYDIEEYAGQPFIAMELLEGTTLQQRLASTAAALPVSTIVDIAIQVCLGLEAAHGKQIVHRDIKPGNIFLTSQGTVKLLDFGVAKVVAAPDTNEVEPLHNRTGELRPPPHVSLTRTDITPGTTGYMSPEQVRRESLDGRSDLFSLGLVLYEMCTGRRAFAGDTAVAVREAILTTTPSAVHAVNETIPPSLAAIVTKALHKDRAERYQSAAEMRHDLERVRRAPSQPLARRPRRWTFAAAAALAVVMVAIALWVQGRRRSALTLAPSDTIVLAHLTNRTSDPVFDEAVFTALRIALEQTPYMNVMADHKVVGTLGELGLAADTRITPEIAQRVCHRAGSRFVVAPTLADAGNQYRMTVRAIECSSGTTVSAIDRDVASRNEVVATLGTAAVQLRRALGEPAASIAAYDVPLQQATSASPEALELLTLGYRRTLAGRWDEAMPYYQRAVRVDPGLAQAHTVLATGHVAFGNIAEAIASARAAYGLRDRTTAPMRFQIEEAYFRVVTGDAEQGCAVAARWVRTFPHDVVGRNNFGICLGVLGDLDGALGEARETARLLPSPFMSITWIERAIYADRLDEARATMDEAIRRGFDSPSLRDQQVLLAFLRKDDSAMRQQWAWAEGKPAAHGVVFGKAMVEAYHGRLRESRRLAEAASQLASDSGSTVNYVPGAAIWQATVGLSPAPLPVPPASAFNARLQQAFLLTKSGALEDAREAANALRRDYPSNTMVTAYGLPLIDAIAALRERDPNRAVAALTRSTKFDLARTIFPSMFLTYWRGVARLQAGDAVAAAAEFESILARPGLVGRGVLGPLARLQLARARRAMGEHSEALASYQAFLELWKDADTDVPVYREARAEYAALRNDRQ